MSQFGVLLRRYRGQGRDPVRNRPLSQERLGEWLGEVLGDAGYTGAAVSEWERGRSRISHTQRPVLVALIRVLYLAGGLTDRAAADAFLAAGDYRPLDEAERRRITPHWAAAHRPSEEGWGWAIALGLAELAARPWQWLRERPGGGAPEPLDWTDVALAGLRQLGGLLAHRTRRRPWTWFVVWWAVWRWACPPLHPAAADAHPFQTALTLYAGAACALPAVIAGLVPARTPQSLAARLYVHQGAYLGFHLGTLGLSLAGLLNYHLGFEPWSEEVQWVLAGGLVLAAYLGARQHPKAQQRTPGVYRFPSRAGLVLLVYLAFAPAWAWFLMTFGAWLFNPWLGPLALAATLGLLCGLPRPAKADASLTAADLS